MLRKIYKKEQNIHYLGITNYIKARRRQPRASISPTSFSRRSLPSMLTVTADIPASLRSVPARVMQLWKLSSSSFDFRCFRVIGPRLIVAAFYYARLPSRGRAGSRPEGDCMLRTSCAGLYLSAKRQLRIGNSKYPERMFAV